MYYCPKCTRKIAKERVQKVDRELRERFGVSKLSNLRCPVCDCEYVDLDRVKKGGEKFADKTREETAAP